VTVATRRGAQRILIVAPDFGFPNGAGAVSRVRCYARGLADAGADARVLVVGVRSPHEPDDGNTRVKGSWRGVPFEYATGATRGARTMPGRRLQELRALRRLAGIVLDREERLDAVLYYGVVPRWLIPLRMMCSAARVPLLQDLSEFPGINYPHRGRLRRAAHLARVRADMWLPDGFIVITSFLYDHLRPRVRRRAWMLKVPIMVEAGLFANAVEPVPGLVSYAGNLGHVEEIEDLIAAAASASRRVPGLHLEIIGAASPARREAIERSIRARGMEGRVRLVGQVAADDMPQRLARASALVLARADGVFSRAGMPTKLGEYLATGRPVVVTATGDVPLYLHDGVDSYLVAPGDTDGLAHAMERALTDPRAADIGACGRGVALSCFDPAVHMTRVLRELARDAS
jgi:glycosyltransferase involved in cell wall biosynthesis